MYWPTESRGSCLPLLTLWCSLTCIPAWSPNPALAWTEVQAGLPYLCEPTSSTSGLE